MTKENRKNALANRINVLSNNGKNVKSPGVLNKLNRKLERGNY